MTCTSPNCETHWDQTLCEVNIHVAVGQTVTRDAVKVELTSSRVEVSVSGKTIFGGTLFGRIKTGESTWFLASGTVNLVLEKAVKGEVWRGVLSTDSVDEICLTELKRKMLLERFGEENPGFDFSNAEFSGDTAPDPRTFMGDIR